MTTHTSSSPILRES